MKTAALALLLLTICGWSTCAQTPPDVPTDLTTAERAQALAHDNIIVDGHIDIPYRLAEYYEDISDSTTGGDFDYPRVKAGGLDAPFMSIYIPSSFQTKGGAKAYADHLIGMVDGFFAKWPDKFAPANSVQDVRQNFAKDIVSLPMGMENGAPLESDLSNVTYFYDKGIRYITLTHATDNEICDSSYDTTRTWQGLSPFGHDVVKEMNRVGMIIDVSHVSDSAFYQILRITSAPVVASHSSARSFTPGWERNMSDDMITALAENGGVIMINFGSSFLKREYQSQGNRIRQKVMAHLTRNGIDKDSAEGYEYFAGERRANPVGTVDDVADHIDHVVKLAGIDHVGLGSDFDGVFALPDGLQDVSEYPNLVERLIVRGYSDGDIRKILGENALRVWSEVEALASGSESD